MKLCQVRATNTPDVERARYLLRVLPVAVAAAALLAWVSPAGASAAIPPSG
jgi:hypothetical protein